MTQYNLVYLKRYWQNNKVQPWDVQIWPRFIVDLTTAAPQPLVDSIVAYNIMQELDPKINEFDHIIIYASSRWNCIYQSFFRCVCNMLFYRNWLFIKQYIKSSFHCVWHAASHKLFFF